MAIDIKDVIDELVTITEMNRGMAKNLKRDRSQPQISQMKNLDASHLLECDDWHVPAGGDPDVIWPIHVGSIFRWEGGWRLNASRSVTPKETRGFVRICSPKMMRIVSLELQRDGRYISVVEYYAWINRRWVNAVSQPTTRHYDNVRLMPTDELDHIHKKCDLQIGLALRRRYEWSVTIGRPNSPSFRFATDALGVKQLINERDKGDCGRREALRGWISDHWRKNRFDESEEFYVRKHLRGGEKFSWRGYECVWRPSDYDLEKNENYRFERRMMRGQARRTRAC